MTRTGSRRLVRRLLPVVLVAASAGLAALSPASAGQRPYPILFVTQVPIPNDFTTVTAVLGNHVPSMQQAGRGGDLYILFPDGFLRNLTGEAGYGSEGAQTENSIAVREPAVHWSGTKAVFSMAMGSPSHFQWETYYWQLYEVTSGLAQGDGTVTITKVPGQPTDANNVSPVYLSDGRILFTSDRPRNGAPHLYPQLDEYESAPTVSGIWVLDPASGHLEILDHAPSGAFRPTVDSFGRVIFTRWDHLQRDQQADADKFAGGTNGTFNWTSEAASSTATASRAEVFPEPRLTQDPDRFPWEVGHTFNHFFPWMMNQDGSELETLNHVGRHDLGNFFNRSRTGDGAVVDFNPSPTRVNKVDIREDGGLLQIREDPNNPGRYYATHAHEFGTHAAGRIVYILGEPGRKPDNMPVVGITPTATYREAPNATACHSGLYRNPLPLSDGSLIVVHAGERTAGVPETRSDANQGTTELPASRYSFRMRELLSDNDCGEAGPPPQPVGTFKTYGAPLTGSGIQKTVSYYNPDTLVQYQSVTMWELDPVEVRPRTIPPDTSHPALDAPELAAFAAAGVDPVKLRLRLEEKGQALIVSHNVTTRDRDDRQQPWKLQVPVSGGAVTPVGGTGTYYDVPYLQIFQGDQIRGLGGTVNPSPGRRVLAQPLHEPGVQNPAPVAGQPPGSVAIAADGSMAAFVPAQRALSWQLVDGQTPSHAVVRERFWLTMQPGEVRVCASCHGVSSKDQANQDAPTNTPTALTSLLQWMATTATDLFSTGFEVGMNIWSDAEPPEN